MRGESAGLGYKSLDLGQEAKVYHVIPEVMSVVCAVGAYDKRGGSDPSFFTHFGRDGHKNQKKGKKVASNSP